jgi:hypothetical protein
MIEPIEKEQAVPSNRKQIIFLKRESAFFKQQDIGE